MVAVSSPYDPRGPTVSEDGQTAFATVAFDIEKVGIEELDAAEKAVQDVRDAGIQVEYDGGLGYADLPPGGNSELIGILLAIVILAIAFGSLVAMSLPIVTALRRHRGRQQRHRHHVRLRRGPEDHRHRRDDARARSRHRLRAVHPDPAPPEPCGRPVRARGHRPCQRHRRPVGAVRRRDRDGRDPRAQAVGHPDDGEDGLRLGDHGRRRHARVDHAASRDPRDRQAPREQRPGPVRQAEAGGQPGCCFGQVGRAGGRQAAALRRRGSGHPRNPRDPGLLDAPGLRRRGQRCAGHDDPQVLRPDGRGLRRRHQRSARGGSRDRRRHDPERRDRAGLDRAGERAGRGLGEPAVDERRRGHRDHQRRPDHVTAGREDR